MQDQSNDPTGLPEQVATEPNTGLSSGLINDSAPTLGEFRVRLTFDPSEKYQVTKIKRLGADFIDYCQALRNDLSGQDDNYDLTPEEFNARYYEVLRLIDEAQKAAELAVMWAVKAATA